MSTSPPTASTSRRESPVGFSGWKRKGLEDRRQEAGEEHSDLWQALDDAQARHMVTWHWVRGHDGHTENERVARSRQAAEKAKNPD